MVSKVTNKSVSKENKVADLSHAKAKTGKYNLSMAIVILVLAIVSFNITSLNSIIRTVLFFIFLATSVALFFTSNYGRKIIQFFKEAKIELKRIVWPSVSETKQATIYVMCIIALTILYLLIVDTIWHYLIKLFIS